MFAILAQSQVKYQNQPVVYVIYRYSSGTRSQVQVPAGWATHAGLEHAADPDMCPWDMSLRRMAVAKHALHGFLAQLPTREAVQMAGVYR